MLSHGYIQTPMFHGYINHHSAGSSKAPALNAEEDPAVRGAGRMRWNMISVNMMKPNEFRIYMASNINDG